MSKSFAGSNHRQSILHRSHDNHSLHSCNSSIDGIPLDTVIDRYIDSFNHVAMNSDTHSNLPNYSMRSRKALLVIKVVYLILLHHTSLDTTSQLVVNYPIDLLTKRCTRIACLLACHRDWLSCSLSLVDATRLVYRTRSTIITQSSTVPQSITMQFYLQNQPLDFNCVLICEVIDLRSSSPGNLTIKFDRVQR